MRNVEGASGEMPSIPADPSVRALMPNLFVIGSSKSGSSAFHAYLRSHPQICMSREKEPCFFVDQEELRAAWPIMERQACSHEWPAYLDLWRGGESAKYRGEGSVFYSQSPHRSGVAERIAKACPDARILYTVREPVRRAIGHYWQRYKEFAEALSLDEAVRENALYRDTSDYALQLEQYLEHFDISQIKVVVAEELRSNRREVLGDVFDWLEIEQYDYSEGELVERHKSPSTSRKPRFPLVASFRDSGLWAAMRGVLPNSIVKQLRSASTTTFEKSSIEENGAREYLQGYLNPRRAKFEALIGRKITGWGDT